MKGYTRHSANSLAIYANSMNTYTVFDNILRIQSTCS